MFARVCNWSSVWIIVILTVLAFDAHEERDGKEKADYNIVSWRTVYVAGFGHGEHTDRLTDARIQNDRLGINCSVFHSVPTSFHYDVQVVAAAVASGILKPF